jgi:membrane protein implicated in regulation of membrane protease activity
LFVLLSFLDAFDAFVSLCVAACVAYIPLCLAACTAFVSLCVAAFVAFVSLCLAAFAPFFPKQKSDSSRKEARLKTRLAALQVAVTEGGLKEWMVKLLVPMDLTKEIGLHIVFTHFLVGECRI